jgi:hypothetical protein
VPHRWTRRPEKREEMRAPCTIVPFKERKSREVPKIPNAL